MKKRSGIKSFAQLFMPLLLLLAGAGLAALGVALGSLILIAIGIVVAGVGVLWAVVRLDLTNLFDWF